ncbi:Mediator of RNA polymerase II transcription subunit 16 [Salvia divinorum]|uniref:Mediator of RNA polymerase II transcription subunit 16 n=1 Tax=Salvia divinorum TaxID=28513 RepID=A0ABD1HUQ9_SALDI
MRHPTSNYARLYLLLEDILHIFWTETTLLVHRYVRACGGRSKRQIIEMARRYIVLCRVPSQLKHIDRLLHFTDAYCVANRAWYGILSCGFCDDMTAEGRGQGTTAGCMADSGVGVAGCSGGGCARGGNRRLVGQTASEKPVAGCSTANSPFWIPIHIVIPERPTECTVFNVIADSPRDSVQFIEWSPTSCPRALLIANFHGRITIWMQPSQGPANLVKEASCWQLEYEWRQDIAVVTKWLSGASPYRRLSARSSGSTKSTFEEKFLSQQPHAPAGWPNFLCVCSVFSSGSVQLHWSQWPPNQNGAPSKWFCTRKGLLGAGPSGIMAADAIVTDSGALHVAGVPIVNPSTVVVWEVTPGPGNGFQAIPKTSLNNEVPPSLNPPSWDGFAALAAYLFSWQEYLLLEAKQGVKKTEQDYSDVVILHCSPVSNFSAYVSPEAAAQSAATTTWGSGVTAVAFDPTCGGSVISVVIVEGIYFDTGRPTSFFALAFSLEFSSAGGPHVV